MNKSETKSETEEFLRGARELIGQKRVFLVPRDENRRWIRELDLITEQAWELMELGVTQLARVVISSVAENRMAPRQRR